MEGWERMRRSKFDTGGANSKFDMGGSTRETLNDLAEPKARSPLGTREARSADEDALGEKSRQDPQQKHYIKFLFILLALGGLATIIILNLQVLMDIFAGFGYSPSPAMSTIRTSLDLTGDGERIFNASHPVLNSKDEFNQACDSHKDETAVLGCYTNRQIHVYDVEAENLNGIKESTVAHELLHAVWSRLSEADKNQLKPKLEEVYQKSEQLKSELENYEEKDREDELHSRIGTEIKNLDDELEKHFAKYFKDQDKIVAYYDSYIKPFETLKKQIDELSKTLENLKKQIDEKTKEYQTRSEKLNQEISEFNNCASTLNCFATRGEFNTRRAELSAEQAAVNSLYDELDNTIKDYNAKVGEYNNSILKNRDLENLINSNKEVKV
ncbi:hypothetical protein IKF27_00275 [Candidatus Saccharibacteria bacterium]|nr:hypothetical protein [Candidatus Saccharibacteria bacterium]